MSALQFRRYRLAVLLVAVAQDRVDVLQQRPDLPRQGVLALDAGHAGEAVVGVRRELLGRAGKERRARVTTEEAQLSLTHTKVHIYV
eukprot:COSAG01_NODE_33252_length_567_cov_1.213675_1_plen_87_part_00